MLVLICGDRKWADYRCERCSRSAWACPTCTASNKHLRDRIKQEVLALNLDPASDTIIEGDAAGADRIGGEVAKELGIPLLVFPANWKLYDKGAGTIRNQEMLDEKPNLVLAFHRDITTSKGTKHMVKISEAAGVEVRVYSA